MKHFVVRLWVLLVLSLVMTGCVNRVTYGDSGARREAAKTAVPTTSGEEGLTQAILNSYYSAQSTPAFEKFRQTDPQKDLIMWVGEEIGEFPNLQWNYDSFTQIAILDHDFGVSREDETLYCITFSDGIDRYGYMIVKYTEDDSCFSGWSVTETTPYLYDLRADRDGIQAGLSKTDLDFPTAKASRVYLFDRENRRADQVIRFEDGKGDNYIYYLGDPTAQISKWGRTGK